MEEKAERRRWHRSSVVGGSAICRGDGTIGGYKVVDASFGGVCLNHGVPLPQGTELEMALWCAGLGLATLRGTVVRSNEDTMAVAFAQVGWEARELLSELARAENAGGTRATSLVFCPVAPTTDTLQDLLASLGHDSVSVATPLDGIVQLQRMDHDVREVFAEDSPAGRDFLKFVRDEHPEIRRVLLTPPEATTPSCADDDLADRVVHLWVSAADSHALRDMNTVSTAAPHFARGTVSGVRRPRGALFGTSDTRP